MNPDERATGAVALGMAEALILARGVFLAARGAGAQYGGCREAERGPGGAIKSEPERAAGHGVTPALLRTVGRR